MFITLKASGPDDISAEALKVDIDTSTEMYPLFEKIWNEEDNQEHGRTDTS